MHYRLIALDLDGTLLTSRKEISPRTREALMAARARGIVTAIATGRASRSAQQFSRRIGGGPIICCNGAEVLDEGGTLLVGKGMPLAPLQRALQVCRAHGVLVECYTPTTIILDRPVDQIKAFMRWTRPKMSLGRSFRSLVEMWATNRIRMVPNLLSWTQKPNLPPIFKLFVVSEDLEKLALVARQMHAETPGLSITSSGEDNLEIMAAGVNKGSGLQQLGARLKIPREAMIAFGDSANDVEMLQYAGMGVAMGNAAQDIKAIARTVTGTCDEDGIAQIIERLCLS